jgi:hypothetical protein
MSAKQRGRGKPFADKSIAWKSDGSAVLASTVQFSGTNALINTYSAP